MSLRTHIPSSYMDVRPHHVLVLYTVLTGVASSGIYKKVANVMLSLTARCMNSMIMPLSDKGMVPDFLVRMGIRLQLRDQLQQAVPVSAADAMDAKMSVLHQLSGSSGENADAESAGIVELPAAIYGMCLGPSKKYSAGLWTDKSTTLAESETNMLKLYCERAGVKDGMKIVDLGCGVGSLSLYIAEKYPHCQITGISNNNAHRRSILKTAAAKNLSNVRVLTCDVADDKGVLDVVKDMDLIMTVEMLEHMQSYEKVMAKLHGFLKPGGKLFVEAATHKDYSMGNTPSDDLLLYCTKDFGVVDHWLLNGSHYAKTATAWLNNLDASWKKGSLKPILAFSYGNGKEKEWYTHWRKHFLATSEQWCLAGGEEFVTSHYLLQRG